MCLFSVSQSGYHKCTALSYRGSAEPSTRHGAGGEVYVCAAKRREKNM